MRQLDGLGSRRGARGEQHDRDIVGVGKLGDRLGGAGGGDELLGGHHLLADARDHVAYSASAMTRGVGSLSISSRSPSALSR